MPRTTLALAVGLLSLCGPGCATLSNTDGGILAGGGLGAAAGALAGSRTGHAGAGALVGGALGAVAGGITGGAIDRSEARVARAAAARQPPLSVSDVVRLTQSGISDEVILTQIRTTGSRYHLTADDLTMLTGAGVRERVIREMQATAARPVHVAQPVLVAEPVVVYPAPPPPIGFGVTYIRRCR